MRNPWICSLIDGPILYFFAMQSSTLFSLAIASFFHNYIGESLKDSPRHFITGMFSEALGFKTVIYVTHQVEVLPAADLILVSYSCLVSSTYLYTWT